MSKVELRYRKKQRMNALFEEITNSFTDGVLKVEVGSPTYVMLQTHPRNKDRVDEVVIWNCAGFRGFKK